MGWKPEYLVKGKWCQNGVCFATEGEALMNALDLMARWFVPEDYRAVEVTDLVTHTYIDHRLGHLPLTGEDQMVADYVSEGLGENR